MKKLLLVFLLFSISATAQTPNTATITFDPVTTYIDGAAIPNTAVISYDLYQGLNGRVRTRVGSFVSGGSINTGLLAGAEYCWHVVAIVDGISSDPSDEKCKKFNNVPSRVIITVT